MRPPRLFQYASISRLLLKAPAQYGLSFLHTETDGFDATYFLLYHLGILRRAIEDLFAYLLRKGGEARETEALLRRGDLERRGLLERRVVGRRFEFLPASELRERLRVAASASAG